jgi:hypothetical protein
MLKTLLKNSEKQVVSNADGISLGDTNHDTIEYCDTNLETILISDRFGFNRNIDISRYIAITIKYRNIVMYFLAETSCTT